VSVVAGVPQGVSASSESALSEDQCAHCGSELSEEQEWCLECGAARTLIHRPPDWRIPLAVIGVVVLLVLAAFGIALVALSSDANRSAQPAGSAPSVAAAAAPAPTATAPSVAAIASWPTGLSGWTVVLDRSRSQSAADSIAQRIGSGGTQVGVLDSSQHPSMTPGYWIVFSGRYPNAAAAVAAAATLRTHGHPTASARRVAPPGGI
jgi:hypothetical protein